MELRLYSHRDIVWTWVLLIPAGALVSFVPADASHVLRGAMTLVALLLWLLALRMAWGPLKRAREAIALMREGIVVPGRVVASRMIWDAKRHEVPHHDLLADWAGHVGRSQMRKGWGCATIFIAPFLLIPGMFVVFAIATAALQLTGHTTLGGREFGSVVIAGLQAIAMIVLVVLTWKLMGRLLVKRVDQHVKRATPTEGSAGGSYEEVEAQLRQLAYRDRGSPGGAAPVPAGVQMEITCRVEYRVGGQPITSESRAFLSNRLDSAGVEPLLVDPGQPARMLLLAGLPEWIAVDAARRWAPVQASGVTLAVAGILATAVLLGIAWHLPAVIAAIRA